MSAIQEIVEHAAKIKNGEHDRVVVASFSDPYGYLSIGGQYDLMIPRG